MSVCLSVSVSVCLSVSVSVRFFGTLNCAFVCEYKIIRSGHETYSIINPALCVEIAHSDSEVEVSND